MNYRIVNAQVVEIRPARKPRKRQPKKSIPRGVLAALPKPQRKPLKQKIRAIGGWDTERACAIKGPRKTWRNTREYARELANRAGPEGLDRTDKGSICFKDQFCNPLELKGKKCPVSKALGGDGGGWPKAVRIGLGSKTRRFSDLEIRPQWRAVVDALKECEGLDLNAAEADAVKLHREMIHECHEGHADQKDRLVGEARQNKLRKRPRRGKVPF